MVGCKYQKHLHHQIHLLQILLHFMLFCIIAGAKLFLIVIKHILGKNISLTPVYSYYRVDLVNMNFWMRNIFLIVIVFQLIKNL